MTSLAEPRGTARPRGDNEAERLYADYSERIFAFCLQRLGSRSEAEDAVQVTFLYALRALRRGVVPECESAWLHTIARNACRWQQRTAARRPLDGDRGLELVASPERDDDHDLLAGLDDALDSLPERQRRALLLREWRGLSADEIGHHLELSAPATHALLTRARLALAQALTAPRRAALSLASVAHELRIWIKAALGGASTKAAVATIAAVGAGAGVVATERTLAGEGERAAPVVSKTALTDASSPVSTRTAPTTRRDSAAGKRPRRAQAPGQELGRSKAAFTSTPSGRARAHVGSLPRRGDEWAPTSPTQPDSREPAMSGSGVPDPPSVELPKAPAPPLDLPEVDAPPVDLPPVDLPPVDLPPVDLPPVDLPTDVLPTVDLPPVDLPPVDVPSVDVPPVEVPPLPPLLP